MSKELIVSSTRHETRVAVLEDDQVVEVFYQRENEYSLAGSIHKGRVTRVLPGMQSAFVDLGLDRDAFLYVSDFFEDNDEYDKVVSSVEDKVLRLEKGTPAPSPAVSAASLAGLSDVAAPAAADAVAAGESAREPEPPQSTVSSQIPAQQSATSQDRRGPAYDRGEDRNGRDRHARRSRRRRPRGRGLPESKYFSPGQASGQRSDSETQKQEAPVEAAVSSDDFAVLPGESLAKYGQAERQPGWREAPPQHDAAITESPTEEMLELEAKADAIGDSESSPVETEAAPGALEETGEAQPSWSTLPEDKQSYDTSELRGEEIAQTLHEEPAELLPGETAVTSGGQTMETASDVEDEAVSATENGAPSGAENETAMEEEKAEPARIPTSLTATLREQGSRYPHRVSRRMRRKMRGDRPPSDSRLGEGRAASDVQRPADTMGEAPTVAVQPAEQQRTQPRPEKTGAPSISDLLREGQEIIVQIAKEPLGQKGARITSHIALPGRFLVYMPTVEHVGVSRKIPSDEERSRLKRILQTHRTGMPGGFIVRTAGEGKTEQELHADMMFLYNMWMDIRHKAEKRPAPALIHHDLGLVQRILRDQLTSAFKTVWVDNEEIYESVLSFVQAFQPAMVGRIKLYTRSAPIFDEFNVTQELEKALRPKVWLKSGGYIVINQTEALVAIDINTGKYVGRSNRLEDTIVKTNTDAIKEIVRQIRLRDLGGIIVVDFIDMDERKNRQKVMQALEESMRADRAPYKILQFNDFGLVAITRKRVKQSLERTLCAPCPYCEGAGYVKSVQTVIGEILQEAQKVAKVLEAGDVMLRVHPEVAKVLKSNRNDYLQEIEQILGRNVLVKSDNQMHQEKFDLA